MYGENRSSLTSSSFKPIQRFVEPRIHVGNYSACIPIFICDYGVAGIERKKSVIVTNLYGGAGGGDYF